MKPPPPRPVGLLVSPHGLQELANCKAKIPCPVAVSRAVPPDAVRWFFRPADFAPYRQLTTRYSQ